MAFLPDADAVSLQAFQTRIQEEYLLVAEEDARIVGFGSLKHDEIESLDADPDRSGSGIGADILRNLEAHALRCAAYGASTLRSSA